MSSSRSHSPPARRLGVLFSGGGRTLENLVLATRDGRLDAEVIVAITDRPGAAGIERSRRLGIDTIVHDPKALGTSFSAAIAQTLREYAVGTVVMAGFLKLWDMPEDYQSRVLNIHPSLLPAFGGHGFYGMRVHRAVHDAGVRVTGCTVHYADREYDRGPIIVQRTVPIEFEDTPETIAARVFEQECIAYPEALALHVAGRLEVHERRVRILEMPPGERSRTS